MPFTVGFGLILAAAEIGYSTLSVSAAARVAAWASTNVARLTTEPIGPLVVSVFVVEGYRLMWLVLGTLGCALVEARLGWRRTLLMAVVTQLGGTAVSEGIVWWRVRHDRLPDSALHQLDVGASYVAVGLLTVAVFVARPVTARVLAGLCLAVIGPHLLNGLSHLDVSPVGHLTAFVVAGIFVGVLVVGPNRRQRIQDRSPLRTE
ncbi:MAG: hypothetical protein M3Y44_00905 [Actinomycetota bacterium]|nr:hypothetical protein [Actinomycetota bacterium]